MTINYDGRVFRSSAAETAGSSGSGPTGHYHQERDHVWAEFSGGAVIRGFLTGTCHADGSIEFAYCQLLPDGPLAGQCTSRPELLPDGRVRLHEHWHRFDGSRGVSVIEELRHD